MGVWKLRIVGEYSFAGGAEFVKNKFPTQLQEIRDAVNQIDATQHKTKESKEKTMQGRMLYSPSALNTQFKNILKPKGWVTYKVDCQYDSKYYLEGYSPTSSKRFPFRDMDFVKDGLGVEVQFGKYAFMVYNVAAKMTIFRNLGVIQGGIEIVPVKELAEEMSTGVSYFEQFCWDLDQRGVSNIDTPVLVLGITL
jgi:hypothetical protein